MQGNNSKVPRKELYTTLGYGQKARKFYALEQNDYIYIFTGENYTTPQQLHGREIERCIEHFSGTGWFPLGNSIDYVKEGSLGEYFKCKLKVSPKFASHFAAVLVKKSIIIYRFGPYNRVELKVIGGIGEINRLRP